jgi:hypothetical protein
MTPAVPAVRKGAILIVECLEIRSFLKFLLGRAGLNVLEAEPECGGQMLAEHLEDVELIIANRPEQFVGSGIPIIYIAAIPDAEMTKHCAQVLPKPFIPADLLFHVERIRLMEKQKYAQGAS